MKYPVRLLAARLCAPVFGSLMLLSGALFPALAQEQPKDAPTGYVTIEQVQVAFLGSGALGGGALQFQGKTYKFKLGGLGVGGIGASRLSASGDVYGLTKLSDFEGPYGELRTGWALGDNGNGNFWLRNAKGVYIRLKGTREGLQLSAGAEAVVIAFE